jgi:hypothetical protein
MEWGIGGWNGNGKANQTLWFHKRKAQSLVPHKVNKLCDLFLVFWVFWKMPIVIHSLAFMKIYYSSKICGCFSFLVTLQVVEKTTPHPLHLSWTSMFSSPH